VASALDVELSTIVQILGASAQPAVLATSKAMGRFETSRIGTGKARLLLRYHPLLRPEALTVLSAVTVLLLVEIHRHGEKGGLMQGQGLRGVNLLSDPSLNEYPLQQNRTVNGEPK
jgi:hypothetical protein